MKDNISRPISEADIQTVRECMEYGKRHGASAMRISLNKSISDSITMLNGETDKVIRAADSSIFMHIFSDGKYGTFSTNDLGRKHLEKFILGAIGTVRMFAEDPFRKLPPRHRTEKGALTGLELELYDPEYISVTPEMRLGTASGTSAFKDTELPEGWSLISEECEYSDSVEDTFIADTEGFEGRHTETSFAACAEVTLMDKTGSRLSGYDWESSPFRSGLYTSVCAGAALKKATEKTGPRKHRGGRFPMVVDRTVSSRLLAPVISALNGSALQQKNSFLEDTLGKKIFSADFTLADMARESGRPGSRLFDTEGVATENAEIISKGAVARYFINTYISEKTGMAPTSEGISRPCIKPFASGTAGPTAKASAGTASAGAGMKVCESGEKAIILQDILTLCDSGIYVTGFNGGNCNPTTGDFSYGVEGFAFRHGQILYPIREMVVTGNMKDLWNDIVAAGSDSRPCTRWQIPTLAFGSADFSA